MSRPFQRKPAPNCPNGMLSHGGLCVGTCAYHGARQRLIYEFVNLDQAAQLRAFHQVMHPVDGDEILESGQMLLLIQEMDESRKLWQTVQREGGDLGPKCPF